MDSIRRCDDCRRVIHGEAGNACPYCGGSRLNRMIEHGTDGPQLHAPIFFLTILFCCGLAGMQVAAIVSGFKSPHAGHAGPLWHLNAIVGAGFVVYWSVRRTEGDFRALALVALGLFVLGECMSALARAYGIGALRGLSGVFKHSLLVFSSLGITAGATDQGAHSRHETMLMSVCGGFLFLAILHLTSEFFHIENDAIDDIATAVVALGLAAFAGIVLWRERAARLGGKSAAAPLIDVGKI